MNLSGFIFKIQADNHNCKLITNNGEVFCYIGLDLNARLFATLKDAIAIYYRTKLANKEEEYKKL